MQIEIQIPRPGTTLLAIAAVTGWAMYWGSATQTAQVAPAVQVISAEEQSQSHEHEELPAGGELLPDDSAPVPIIPGVGDGKGLTEGEMRMKWTRAEQQYLLERENIIRAQIDGLQKQREALGEHVDPELEEEFRSSVRLLTSLLQDRQKGEQFLLASYRQMWEAEERAMSIASPSPASSIFEPLWPVEPEIGISAYFMDEGYKERFKVEHYAVDIPVAQGSTVTAAAAGLVKDVVDHGLGYSYMTIDHGGYVTVYGHLSRFDVAPGQRVRAGERIGLSGGMPGLPGGGSSTGPHLHFGVYKDGKPVDPLKYLPKR